MSVQGANTRPVCDQANSAATSTLGVIGLLVKDDQHWKDVMVRCRSHEAYYNKMGASGSSFVKRTYPGNLRPLLASASSFVISLETLN